MHRIKCVHRVGGFDESGVITKHSNEDYELWLRIADYFKFYYLNKVLSKFIYHGANRTPNIDWPKSCLYVMRKRWQLQKTGSKRLKYIQLFGIEVIKRLLETNCFKDAYRLAREFHNTADNCQALACLGLCELIKGNFKEAMDLLKMSLKKLPRDGKDIITIKLYLAKAYYKLGEISLAEKTYQEVLKIMRNDIEAIEVKRELAKCYLIQRLA